MRIRTVGLIALLAVAGALLVPQLIPTTSGQVCPIYSTSGNGDTFNVMIVGADNSCPPIYSNSATIHYALLTGLNENPYTVTLSGCSGTVCPPTEIILTGWANNQIVCGGSKPACSQNGPWTFNVNATVQAGQVCNTAPVKIAGTSGQPVLILEAGQGGDCISPPTGGVPEFPTGSIALIAVLPMLFLLRKFSFRPAVN